MHPEFGCCPHRDFPFHMYEMVIFLSVVTIKICNEHNWDVYSISPVSSCQVGLYDTDFVVIRPLLLERSNIRLLCLLKYNTVSAKY